MKENEGIYPSKILSRLYLESLVLRKASVTGGDMAQKKPAKLSAKLRNEFA